MKYFALTAVLWIASAVIIGCSTKDERAGQPVPVFAEYKGQQGPFTDRGFFVVQRPEIWTAVWAGRQAPNVDFTQNSVLVALMGRQPTAGYNITISDVRATGTDIIAYIDEARPRAGEQVAQVITYPYHMVVVPKLTQPVAFQVEGATTRPIAIHDVLSGQYSQAVDPRTRVIRTAEDWQAFWTATLGVNQTAPEIDFNRFMAAAVLIGRRPTAGYSVMITGVEDIENRIEVRYRTISPDPDDVVAQVVTAPYAIAILPASPQAVAFRPLTAVMTAEK